MTAADVPAAHIIRLRVRENRLSDPSRVTEQDYHRFLTRDTASWVCELNGALAGFTMVDVENGELWALFVAPEHEGKGIGRALHDAMLAWYSQRRDRLRLSTAPGTRAEAFYGTAGYHKSGTTVHGEVVLELRTAGTGNAER